jgi:nitrogen fixation/metabolism regulation signal transduction histidine kinase
MTTPEPRRHGLPAFERRILLGGALVAVPALSTLLAVLVLGTPAGWPAAALPAAVVVLTAVVLRWHYRRLIYPVYTLASLLEALREGDYSLRGVQGGVLAHLVYDVNALAERLQGERLQFEESAHLLGKTLAALDSAVLVFDEQERLRLINPAAQRLLQAERHQLFGRSAAELGLTALLGARSGQVLDRPFAGCTGRFEIRHAPLRMQGRSGRLLVLSDVGQVLREEERQAWQRLLRVLGHEVNNSLAPIQSMAGTLASLLEREPLPADWRDDARHALAVVGQRAAALGRFLASYSRLARLPPPQRRPVALRPLLAKVAGLESRVPVTLAEDEPVTVEADADQLEQALINLLRNAAEAALPLGGAVGIGWRVEEGRVVVEIRDDGPGPPASDNLFVPFFTTKPGGSGIGLALARQIAEAHEGGVTLAPREDAPGALATLWLPRRGGGVDV